MANRSKNKFLKIYEEIFMKKLFILFLFFVSTNIFAQKYSVGINYSSLISKTNNYRSGYLFPINGIMKYLKIL